MQKFFTFHVILFVNLFFYGFKDMYPSYTLKLCKN